MAPAHESPTPAATGLVADVEALASAASHAGRVADLLTSGTPGSTPGVPPVLPALVPQAAGLVAALQRARGRQADALAGFSGFYRASASSLDTTAGNLADGEAGSAAGFASTWQGASA
ncbi:hypothetical protein ACT3SZ_08550 [Corynebacterium sp. AOP40-9SA-29]|uniref:hypothetical protein n=1 Tax=Corynebacterium sp. AOP40-9SA-29 TaxID=3457677 RepID=UPI004033A62E